MITDENIKDVINAFFIPEEIKDELREKIPEIRAGLEARNYYFSVRCRSDLEARILIKQSGAFLECRRRILVISNGIRYALLGKMDSVIYFGGRCETKDEETCDTSRDAYRIGYYAGYREAVQNHHDALMTLIKKRNEKADEL